jgi:hypothetical protein
LSGQQEEPHRDSLERRLIGHVLFPPGDFIRLPDYPAAIRRRVEAPSEDWPTSLEQPQPVWLRGAVIEDCVVDGLRGGGLMHMDGCAYEHVIVRGEIGQLLLTNAVVTFNAEIKRRFEEANAIYYAGVDWALDISEARFGEQIGLRGIPSALVRRDPRTQVVVTRKRIEERPWSDVDLDARVRTWIRMMVGSGWPDGVFVVPETHPRRQSMLESLEMLRPTGVAEPD